MLGDRLAKVSRRSAQMRIGRFLHAMHYTHARVPAHLDGHSTAGFLFPKELFKNLRWRRGQAPTAFGTVANFALECLTTGKLVVIMSNMKATLLARTRIVYSGRSFAELVLWRVPTSLAGSTHVYKYRMAYVVDAVCVVRYDNEVGKGDHRHFGPTESSYRFRTPEKFIADFQIDIARWNDENGGA